MSHRVCNRAASVAGDEEVRDVVAKAHSKKLNVKKQGSKEIRIEEVL